MSLVSIPLFFGANNLYQSASGGGNCTDTSGAGSQPQQSSDANGIPSNYLALYKKAGQQYGIPWNVLAESGRWRPITASSRRPGSSAARTTHTPGGRCSSSPAPGRTFGVDGNGDGKKDRYDPADAIPAAARYLKHNGAPDRMRTAIFITTTWCRTSTTCCPGRRSMLQETST